MKSWLVILALGALVTGCATSHSVIVSTGTVLGVAVAENPSTGMYEARFGYARTEFAHVPSNRARHTNEVSIGQGAKDTANVLMEVRMENLFKGGLVYQRLAVGDSAVTQPGATLLFSKSPNGTTDTAALAAVQSIKSPEATAVASALPLANAYRMSDNKDAFDAIARKNGFISFSAFLIDPDISQAKVDGVARDLKTLGLIP